MSAFSSSLPKDKKPFTYAPGGIDFSQLKSPRMAKRIAKHQEETPPTVPAPSSPSTNTMENPAPVRNQRSGSWSSGTPGAFNPTNIPLSGASGANQLMQAQPVRRSISDLMATSNYNPSPLPALPPTPSSANHEMFNYNPYAPSRPMSLSPPVARSNSLPPTAEFQPTPIKQVLRKPQPPKQGLPPPHPQQGLPPSNHQQGLSATYHQQGLHPPHPQQGLPPAHYQQGLPPNHQQGLPPSHHQQGLPPPHPQQGLPPAHYQQGLPPTHQQGLPPQGLLPHTQQGMTLSQPQQGLPPYHPGGSHPSHTNSGQINKPNQNKEIGHQIKASKDLIIEPSLNTTNVCQSYPASNHVYQNSDKFLIPESVQSLNEMTKKETLYNNHNQNISNNEFNNANKAHYQTQIPNNSQPSQPAILPRDICNNLPSPAMQHPPIPMHEALIPPPPPPPPPPMNLGVVAQYGKSGIPYIGPKPVKSSISLSSIRAGNTNFQEQEEEAKKQEQLMMQRIMEEQQQAERQQREEEARKQKQLMMQQLEQQKIIEAQQQAERQQREEEEKKQKLLMMQQLEQQKIIEAQQQAEHQQREDEEKKQKQFMMQQLEQQQMIEAQQQVEHQQREEEAKKQNQFTMQHLEHQKILEALKEAEQREEEARKQKQLLMQQLEQQKSREDQQYLERQQREEEEMKQKQLMMKQLECQRFIEEEQQEEHQQREEEERKQRQLMMQQLEHQKRIEVQQQAEHQQKEEEERKQKQLMMQQLEQQKRIEVQQQAERQQKEEEERKQEQQKMIEAQQQVERQRREEEEKKQKELMMQQLERQKIMKEQQQMEHQQQQLNLEQTNKQQNQQPMQQNQYYHNMEGKLIQNEIADTQKSDFSNIINGFDHSLNEFEAQRNLMLTPPVTRDGDIKRSKSKELQIPPKSAHAETSRNVAPTSSIDKSVTRGFEKPLLTSDAMNNTMPPLHTSHTNYNFKSKTESNQVKNLGNALKNLVKPSRNEDVDLRLTERNGLQAKEENLSDPNLHQSVRLRPPSPGIVSKIQFDKMGSKPSSKFAKRKENEHSDKIGFDNQEYLHKRNTPMGNKQNGGFPNGNHSSESVSSTDTKVNSNGKLKTIDRFNSMENEDEIAGQIITGKMKLIEAQMKRDLEAKSIAPVNINIESGMSSKRSSFRSESTEPICSKISGDGSFSEGELSTDETGIKLPIKMAPYEVMEEFEDAPEEFYLGISAYNIEHPIDKDDTIPAPEKVNNTQIIELEGPFESEPILNTPQSHSPVNSSIRKNLPNDMSNKSQGCESKAFENLRNMSNLSTPVQHNSNYQPFENKNTITDHFESMPSMFRQEPFMTPLTLDQLDCSFPNSFSSPFSMIPPSFNMEAHNRVNNMIPVIENNSNIGSNVAHRNENRGERSIPIQVENSQRNEKSGNYNSVDKTQFSPPPAFNKTPNSQPIVDRNHFTQTGAADKSSSEPFVPTPPAPPQPKMSLPVSRQSEMMPSQMSGQPPKITPAMLHNQIASKRGQKDIGAQENSSNNSSQTSIPGSHFSRQNSVKSPIDFQSSKTDADYRKNALNAIVGEISSHNSAQPSKVGGLRRGPNQSPSMRLLGRLHSVSNDDQE